MTSLVIWHSSRTSIECEEDDDRCPGIQVVNRALGLAVVIQKGMSHQAAVFSFFSINLEKLRPNIFSRSCFDRPDPSKSL